MIAILDAAFAAIRAHMAHDWPREACGLLFGAGDTISEALAIANQSSNPHVAFELDCLEMARAVSQRRDRFLGYYHSHPTGSTSPSSVDRESSIWPPVSPVLHLIVDGAGKVALFRVDVRGWQALPHIVRPIADFAECA